jgi:transposase-like protein
MLFFGSKIASKCYTVKIYLSKTQEAEKMGIKNVLIVGQTIQEKGFYKKQRQRYRCKSCGRQFQNKAQQKRLERVIWNEYVYQRQTIRSLSKKHGKGKDWIRNRIRNVPANRHYCCPQPVMVIADVTFVGRSSGVCVLRPGSANGIS